jgi:hypothetical protein
MSSKKKEKEKEKEKEEDATFIPFKTLVKEG